MLHLAGYYQSIDPGGVLTPITAVQDPVLTTQGNDVRIPSAVPYLVGALALLNDASAAAAQLQSPSLRAEYNLDIEPVIASNKVGNYTERCMWPDDPIQLDVNESLNFAVKSDPAAAADHYGLVWLSDGKLQPVAGEIISIAGTGAAALAAGKWVNTNITFGQVLPAGKYAAVGLRARGTNLVAARLVFPGGTMRPGVAAQNTVAQFDIPGFRRGEYGVWGQFDNTTPPTIDCLGVTDVAQNFVLDLIKVSG